MKWFFMFTCLIMGHVRSAADGHQLYAEGKFREALDAFSQLEKQGIKGQEIYFNKGMCHYKLSEPTRAILYFERALKWDPLCKVCQDMLNASQKNAGIDSFVLPEQVFSRFYFLVLYQLNSIWWFLIAVVMLGACLYVKYFAFESAANKNKKLLFRGFIAVALIGGFMALHREYLFQSKEYYILMDPSPLKKSPDQNSPDLLQLLSGLKVKKMIQLGDWIKVQTPEFDSGWLPAEKLTAIEL